MVIKTGWNMLPILRKDPAKTQHSIRCIVNKKRRKITVSDTTKKKKNMAGCPLEPHVLVQFEDDNSSV